jgi:hypothetical protein
VVKTGDQQPPVLTGEQARLRELFASGDRPPAAGPPPVEPTPRAAPREVPQQTLLSVVRRNQGSPGLKLCYERALKRDLSLANARVDVSVTIGLSGAVKRVNILNDRYRGEYIGTCLAEVIRRWRFPAADSEYTTSFPLILQGS